MLNHFFPIDFGFVFFPSSIDGSIMFVIIIIIEWRQVTKTDVNKSNYYRHSTLPVMALIIGGLAESNVEQDKSVTTFNVW